MVVSNEDSTGIYGYDLPLGYARTVPLSRALLAFTLFGYGSLLSSQALHGRRERIQAGRELTQTEHNVDRGVYFDCLAVEHRGLVAPLLYRIHRRLHQKWRPRNVL
jgi:hypothetical protein